MKRKAGVAAGHGLARGPQGQGTGAACGRRASAGGSRRTGSAPLGASFIYALLSKNAVNRGFFYVLVSLWSVAKS